MEKLLSILEMAGYCAADGVSGVSTGEILMPTVGTLRSEGTRQLTRLVGGSIQAFVRGMRSHAADFAISEAHYGASSHRHGEENIDFSAHAHLRDGGLVA